VCWDDKNGIGERVWMRLEIENMEKALWMGTGVGIIYDLLCWDDENEIGERVWMGLEMADDDWGGLLAQADFAGSGVGLVLVTQK
jgi:hypothetical protein